MCAEVVPVGHCTPEVDPQRQQSEHDDVGVMPWPQGSLLSTKEQSQHQERNDRDDVARTKAEAPVPAAVVGDQRKVREEAAQNENGLVAPRSQQSGPTDKRADNNRGEGQQSMVR